MKIKTIIIDDEPLAIKVLEDFDNEGQIPDIDGIARKEDIIEVEIPDGKVYTFGNDELCDAFVPQMHLSKKQFSIHHYNGKLYAVDHGQELFSKIKVNPNKAFILNKDDVIALGMD